MSASRIFPQNGHWMRTPIYKMAVEEAAWEAVLPESDSPIPNIRADFLRFGSKIVEHSLYLPSSETVNGK
jgi:hypothetical protein